MVSKIRWILLELGFTVNVESDMVRVSSPVTEALIGSVAVTIGLLGSVTLCMMKDADPPGVGDVRELGLLREILRLRLMAELD